jgi:ATP-dependent Lon protease
MPRIKHNKKRNTGFLYETLMVELTKAVLSENHANKQVILEIVKQYFSNDTSLKQDLSFYKALNETIGLDNYTAEKLIFEVKHDRESRINKRTLFTEQTALINLMNRRLSRNVFSNFVPGYKNLATIAQIFNSEISTKQRVLLEKELMQRLISEMEKGSKKKEVVQIDNLTYKTFAKKFNEKYEETLLSEQKDLLNRYVMSFADNGVSLKIFMGDELHRLETALNESLDASFLKDDKSMTDSTQKVVKIIREFKKRPIDEPMIKKVLKIQNLVSEINS